MKAKISLHNSRSNGRIDTFQSSTPYCYKEQQEQQEQHQQQKHTIAVDRKKILNTAYSSSYSQACKLLQTIQMNGRRRLSPHCILKLADVVARAWEANPEREKIGKLAQLMTNLLDTTLLCPEKPLDEALRQFCRNTTPTQSASPSITLLIAIGYIEKLKQRYANIKGTPGCGDRLIMVAYMMASKFMHVNLRLIINIKPLEPSPPISTVSTASVFTYNNPPSSAERSTIKSKSFTSTLSPIKHQEKHQQLPSPPTSPRSYSDSDPLNYHYFQSTKKPANPTTASTTTAIQTDPNISGSTMSPNSYSERHFQILRMELEFLHFLDYDLTLSDTMKLIQWAYKFDEDAVISMSTKKKCPS